MVIDLKHVFVNDNASFPIEYSLDLSTLDFSGVFPLQEPVKITGEIFNRASIVALKARIDYVYNAPCDRCGVLSARKGSLNLDKTLVVSLEGEENENILLTPDMKLDIDELVYAEVVVNLPMKHLCRDDCKGICQKCGKNLNDGICDCPDKEIDPRLSALADLLK